VVSSVAEAQQRAPDALAEHVRRLCEEAADAFVSSLASWF
jgi:hypothetical protein